MDVTESSPEQIQKLALASSTIPLITGSVARVESKAYLDGGFYRFRKDHFCSQAIENIIINIDPGIKADSCADINIKPREQLPSGLRLGLPFSVSQQELCNHGRHLQNPAP